MKAGSVSVFLTLSGGSDPRSFGAEDGDGQENIKYSARICAGRTNSCAVCYSDKECWNVKKWQMRPAGKKEWSTGSRLAVRGSYLLLQPSLRQTANGDPLVVVFRVPGTGQDHFGVASLMASSGATSRSKIVPREMSSLTWMYSFSLPRNVTKSTSFGTVCPHTVVAAADAGDDLDVRGVLQSQQALEILRAVDPFYAGGGRWLHRPVACSPMRSNGHSV